MTDNNNDPDLALAELKRQYAVQERRRQRAANNSRLKEMLEEEQALTALNRKKVDMLWKEKLREVKDKELREKLAELVEDFGRQQDKRDNQISSLVEQLEEAAEQQRREQRGHLVSMDLLETMQRSALTDLRGEYALHARGIQDEFEAELQALRTQHNLALDIQRHALREVEQIAAYKEGAIDEEYKTRLDEQELAEQETFNVMKLTLEARIEEFEAHYAKTYLEYTENTRALTQNYKIFSAKDHENAKTIEANATKLTRLQRQFAHWRSKMTSTIQEYEHRNSALRKEREDIAKHVQDLKKRLENFRAKEHRRQLRLSAAANESLVLLDNQAETAASIMRLADVTKRLETEAERVRPGACELDPAEKASLAEEMHLEMEDDDKDIESPRSLASVDVAVKAAHEMRSFNRRLSGALIDKLALERELLSLRDENKQLKAALQQYLDGITVSDRVLTAPNPLFITQSVSGSGQSGRGGMIR